MSRPSLRTRSAGLLRTGLASAPCLFAAAAGGACATASLPPPAVLEQARLAPSYSATLRVTLKGPELRARTRVLLAFRRPDALRVEVPGPSGARLVAVARQGALAAVFPGERAVFKGRATSADLEALLGVALELTELMDLLLGTEVPRVRDYRVAWGEVLPRSVKATLPDGARLDVKVESAEVGADLPDRAFDEPPHGGYRLVDAREARSLWGTR